MSLFDFPITYLHRLYTYYLSYQSLKCAGLVKIGCGNIKAGLNKWIHPKACVSLSWPFPAFAKVEANFPRGRKLLVARSFSAGKLVPRSQYPCERRCVVAHAIDSLLLVMTWGVNELGLQQFR